jgi:hypothetical protein
MFIFDISYTKCSCVGVTNFFYVVIRNIFPHCNDIIVYTVESQGKLLFIVTYCIALMWSNPLFL